MAADRRYKGIPSETPLYFALIHYITSLAGPGKSVEARSSADKAITEVKFHNCVRFIYTCKIPLPIFDEEPVLAQETLHVVGARNNSNIRFILKNTEESQLSCRTIYSECPMHGIDEKKARSLYRQIDSLYQQADKARTGEQEIADGIPVDIEADDTASIFSSREDANDDGLDSLVIDVEMPEGKDAPGTEVQMLIEYGALEIVLENSPVLLTHRKLPTGVTVSTFEEISTGRYDAPSPQDTETVMMQTLVACYADLSRIHYDRFVSVHPNRNIIFDFGSKSLFEPYTRFADMPLTQSEMQQMLLRMNKIIKKDDVDVPGYLDSSGRLLVEMLKFCQHNSSQILVYNFDTLDADKVARSIFAGNGSVAFYAQQKELLNNIMHQGLVQRGDIPFEKAVSLADCRLRLRGSTLRFVGPGVKHEFKRYFRDPEIVRNAGVADYVIGVLKRNDPDKPRGFGQDLNSLARLAAPPVPSEKTLDEIITSYLADYDTKE